MSNINVDVLPVEKNNVNLNNTSSLFNHFYNLKIGDLPNSKGDPNTRVFSVIVKKIFFKFRNFSPSVELNDVFAEGKCSVLKSANLYIEGVSKEVNKIRLHINYKEKFKFCVFASEQLKYNLKLFFYHQAINKIHGTISDNELNRKIFFNLEKWKKEIGKINQSLNEKDLIKIAENNNIDFKKFKETYNFFETKTLSENYITKSFDHDGKEKKITIWENCANNNLFFENNYEKEINNKINILKFRKILKIFLKNLSIKEKYIFINHTYDNKLNLKDISKTINLSQERIRQISISNFNKLKEFVKKNKSNLELIN